MRSFKEDEKTIVYDPNVELIRETALQCLDEALGHPSEAAEIFNKKKSKLQEEIKYWKEKNRYEVEFEKLNKILTNRGNALEKLIEFVGPELKNKLQKIGTQDEINIMKAIRQKMIIPQWLQSITGTPAGICVACMAGLTFNANEGITENLKYYNKGLHDMVDEVWRNAMNDLHPFQRGPTHQGTKHCTQVLENLRVLLEEIYEERKFTFDIEVRAVLSMAAALHDIGKGDIIDPKGEKHAQNGAKAIEEIPEIFKVDPGFKVFVSKIVSTHAPEGRSKPIRGVGGVTINGKGLNIPCPEHIVEKACSIFQLADTMDTTKDRVSDPVFEALLKVYDPTHPLHGEFITRMRIVEIRRTIDSVYPEWDPDPCIMVKTTGAYNPKVKTQIDSENSDLIDTGAEEILYANNWFSKLEY